MACTNTRTREGCLVYWWREELRQEALFLPLKEKKMAEEHHSPPLCGIIKDGDAKDSLIRFFNYWGFTSSSIVAQLRKLIKQRGDEEKPPPPLFCTIFLHLLFLSSPVWQKRLTCGLFEGWASMRLSQGSGSLMKAAAFFRPSWRWKEEKLVGG